MPTEEVFTTPHRLRTEGVVRSTMPLAVNGQIVRDLTVRFEAGRATEVTASSGADVVREEMRTDEGGSFLGEVALVDGDSRVGQTGIVFFDTLFDENAACHIAYGQGITTAVAGHESATPERARGARLQRLDRAHGLHDRRPRGRGRRHRAGRRRSAAPPRERVGARVGRGCLRPSRRRRDTGRPRSGQSLPLTSSRAHSSAGERSLHTREVPGSIPGAPIKNVHFKRFLSPFRSPIPQ